MLACIAALTALFYWNWKNSRPKYDWNEQWSANAYNPTSKEPYGLQLMRRILDDYLPGKKAIAIDKKLSDQLDTTAEHQNYVFVGGGMYLDSLDRTRLLRFVELGNTALISSKTIPFDLMNFIYYEECPDAPWSDYLTESDTQARLRFYSVGDTNGVACFFATQNVAQLYAWPFIPAYAFCDSLPQQALGVFNDSLINFASFPYGKGRFLLHTTPLALTNFNLLRPEGKAYAANLLAYLNDGPIYWDDYSRTPEAVGRRRNEARYGRDLNAEHPLTYIMRNPPLRWAWYLLLGMGLIFLFFRSKRKERVIPILPKNTNTSLEFIETIANLHFNERDFQSLANRKMKLFLAHIRERYGLAPTSESPQSPPVADEAFIQRLSETSEVPEAAIRQIFTQYAYFNQYQPTEEMTIDLHLAVENFLKKAKHATKYQ